MYSNRAADHDNSRTMTPKHIAISQVRIYTILCIYSRVIAYMDGDIICINGAVIDV